jgi:5-methylcytosine-specific restriction endonuclease McrA
MTPLRKNRLSLREGACALFLSTLAATLSAGTKWESSGTGGSFGSARSACEDLAKSVNPTNVFDRLEATDAGDYRCYYKGKDDKGQSETYGMVFKVETPDAAAEETATAPGAASPPPAAQDDACEEDATPATAAGNYSDLPDDANVKAGADFTPKQKDNIRAANMKRNGGKLMSDDPNDPWYGKELVAPQKGPGTPGNQPAVPKNRAEVDHMISKNNGGTNSYSNAQVLSDEYNNFLNAKKDKTAQAPKKKC